MLNKFVIFFTFILFSPLAYAQGQWGILSFSENKPVVYSFTKIAKNRIFKAYKIDTLIDNLNITISTAVNNPSSPIYSAVGSNSCWEHRIRNPKLIPHGTIWVCLPVSWKLHKNTENEAIITTKSGLRGSITITKQSEGIEINVCINENSDKIYYYLGYDIE
jgi:hypothetical protein